jgi:hypothetical protein
MRKSKRQISGSTQPAARAPRLLLEQDPQHDSSHHHVSRQADAHLHIRTAAHCHYFSAIAKKRLRIQQPAANAQTTLAAPPLDLFTIQILNTKTGGWQGSHWFGEQGCSCMPWLTASTDKS